MDELTQVADSLKTSVIDKGTKVLSFLSRHKVLFAGIAVIALGVALLCMCPYSIPIFMLGATCLVAGAGFLPVGHMIDEQLKPKKKEDAQTQPDTDSAEPNPSVSDSEGGDPALSSSSTPPHSSTLASSSSFPPPLSNSSSSVFSPSSTLHSPGATLWHSSSNFEETDEYDPAIHPSPSTTSLSASEGSSSASARPSPFANVDSEVFRETYADVGLPTDSLTPSNADWEEAQRRHALGMIGRTLEDIGNVARGWFGRKT